MNARMAMTIRVYLILICVPFLSKSALYFKPLQL